MPPPDPFARLAPHDWPHIVDAIVATLRRSAAWDVYRAAIAAAGAVDLPAPRSGDDPCSGPIDTAQDVLLRAAAMLDARAQHHGPFRAGLTLRIREAAAAETDCARAASPARNPFPIRYDAALLAGGSGTRIGGGKPFVPLAGRPLAAWAAAALSRYAERLLVVARTVAEAEAVAEAVAPHIAAPLLAVVDRAGVAGPVGALLGAADVADGFLLTAPVDTPFLPDWAAFALFDGAAPVRVAAATDRPHPTVLMGRARRLRELAPAGSLRATLAALDPVDVHLPEASLFNVNTREDLAEAEARLAGR